MTIRKDENFYPNLSQQRIQKKFKGRWNKENCRMVIRWFGTKDGIPDGKLQYKQFINTIQHFITLPIKALAHS